MAQYHFGKHMRVRVHTPDFLHEAPKKFACAAFSKESRMKFAKANKLDSKSGAAVGCFPA